MSNTREQLVQELVQKIKKVLQSGLAHSYPFKEYTLSRPQVILLFHVAKNKSGVPMKELAEHLCVTNGAITQFIDDLVEKKLLVRENDPKDRRSVRVRLPEENQEHFQAFKQQYMTTLMPRFDNLSTEELQTIVKLFEKIKTV